MQELGTEIFRYKGGSSATSGPSRYFDSTWTRGQKLSYEEIGKCCANRKRKLVVEPCVRANKNKLTGDHACHARTNHTHTQSIYNKTKLFKWNFHTRARGLGLLISPFSVRAREATSSFRRLS